MTDTPQDYLALALEMLEQAGVGLDPMDPEQHLAAAQVHALLAITQRLDALVQRIELTGTS